VDRPLVPATAPLSALLTSFLPFSLPMAQPPTPPLSPDSKEIIPSHAPIKESDPLPLLSLFTPLAMTSTIKAPTKPRSLTESFKQKHEITLTAPSSLLACNLELIISSDPTDPTNPSVDTLEVANLSPWAKREVSHWLESRAAEGDVSAVGFALGRYWDVSVTRAQCWVRCCKELGDLVTCATDAQRSEKTSEQKKRGKRAQRQVDEDEEMKDADDAATQPLKLTKRELHSHLGRQDLVLENNEVILKVSWRVQFDWTGEVESTVSAQAAFPQACEYFFAALPCIHGWLIFHLNRAGSR
jgi:hypothetical protein